MPVNIVGVSSATRTPNVYLNIVFGAGALSNSTNVDKVCVIGHGNVSANAGVLLGPDTTTLVNTAQSAQAQFGANTEMTKFFSTFYKINKQNPLYGIELNDTGTYSAFKLLYSGTTATLTNTLNLWVNNQFFQIPINAGDPLTDNTISTRAANIVNGAKVEFTCTAGVGYLLLIAGSPGVRNRLSVQYALATPDSSVSLSVTAAGSGNNTAATGGTYTSGSQPTSTIANSGNTGGMDTALNTLGANQFYHKVLLPGVDEVAADWANSVAPFVTAITNQAVPTAGNRTYGYCGFKLSSTDTAGGTYVTVISSASGTASATLNNPRMEILWTPNSDLSEAELLATFVGAVSLFEQNLDQPYALNWCAFGSTSDTSPYWGIPQPRNRWTESATTIEQSLEAGLTVVG